MRRIWPERSFDDQIAYHLADGRAPIFDENQPGRVELARFLIDKILKKDLTHRPLRLVELGCGAGDITGPYSGFEHAYQSPAGYPAPGIEVHGWDVTPMAQQECARRWPFMNFHLQAVEAAEPMPCDILVMCEFLEHVDDPVKIVQDWMPLAKWSIIGHPLDEPIPPYEPGHIWSYSMADWKGWFDFGGHHIWERFNFPMGPYEMVMGHGSNKRG